MPPAKTSPPRSSRPDMFREPAALKWLSSSLDAAQQALVELRADAGRDLSQGVRDLHKDLRAFISSARRDTGKLAKALQRDFEHAQKQLAQGTGTAAELASQPEAQAKPKRVTARRASTAPAARSPEQNTANANPRSRTPATATALAPARPRAARVVVVTSCLP